MTKDSGDLAHDCHCSCQSLRKKHCLLTFWRRWKTSVTAFARSTLLFASRMMLHATVCAVVICALSIRIYERWMYSFRSCRNIIRWAIGVLGLRGISICSPKISIFRLLSVTGARSCTRTFRTRKASSVTCWLSCELHPFGPLKICFYSTVSA